MLVSLRGEVLTAVSSSISTLVGSWSVRTVFVASVRTALCTDQCVESGVRVARFLVLSLRQNDGCERQ